MSVMVPVLIGLVRLVRLTRGCEVVGEGVAVKELKELVREVGVTRPVELRRGTPKHRVSMPMAWGGAATGDIAAGGCGRLAAGAVEGGVAA